MKWVEMKANLDGLQMGKKIMNDYLKYGTLAKIADIYGTKVTTINNHLVHWNKLLSKAYPKLYTRYKEACGYSARHSNSYVFEEDEPVDLEKIDTKIFNNIPKQIKYHAFIEKMLEHDTNELSVLHLMEIANMQGIKVII